MPAWIVKMPKKASSPRKMSGLRCAVVLSVALGLAACSPAVPPQQNYATITGIVTDGTTGQPLADATITVDSVLTVTSGADGSFTIANIPVGPYMAVESANGFQLHQDQGNVAAGDHLTLNATLYH